MKVSLNWLAEFVALPTRDVGELTDVLYALGHEVDGVTHLSADWKGVTIAEVLTVDAHPDADKVRLCTVTIGDDPIDVVCGAWNFEAGAKVAFASPGAVLADGFEIGIRDIRGVTSNGMICSERELGLGDEHDGILVLEDSAPVGSDFAEWTDLPDHVFDLTITPNRPDAMSILGIARDLAAHYGVAITMPEDAIGTEPGTADIAVEIEDAEGCLRFTAREIRGARVGPSPFGIRHRLRISGMRPISNAVDVTNYVMLELGQPLHAFDLDLIDGDELVVRRAHAGETLVTLDDVERTLGTDDLVICDASGPTSLAGTMGGAGSEVRETTSRILLEAASWDPPTIMWMSRRHGLRSEASARFERGVDREIPLRASARAAHLLQRMAGGTVVETPVDEVAVPFERPLVELPIPEVERVLGGGFDSDRVRSLLASIGLGVSGSDPLTVEIPGFRPDIERPIDLIEEVARLHGLENFGASVPTGRGGGWSGEQQRARTLRSILVGAGLTQAMHLTFIGIEDLDAFGFERTHEARRTVVVKNPLREEESILRTTLLPGLLRSARYNLSHGASSVALFETGKVFFDRPDPGDDRIPDQPDRLAFVIVGPLGASALGVDPRVTDVYTATAVTRALAAGLGLASMRLAPAERPGFHPGRAAEVSLGGGVIGVVGEIHPVTAAAYELPGRVAAGEVDLAALVGPVDPARSQSPSTFPRIEFDLAFLVDPMVHADTLLRVTTAAGGDVVEEAVVFDVYAGLDDARRSIAIHFVLRSSDRTMTNEEAAETRRAMISAAEELGAELRGAG